MRIAVLSPRMTVRGPLPKVIPVLNDALRRRGCEIEVFPWGRRSEAERLPGKLLGRTRDVIRVRRAVVRGGFPIVVVNTAHDWLTLLRDLALTRALARHDLAVVLHFHGSQSPRLVAPGSWLFKQATAALLASVDGLLVLSHEEKAEWEAFSPRSRVFVTRYPRQTSIEPGPAEGDGPPTILCVARLMSGKGVLELVRALPLVRRHIPARLVLAGDGPERARIQALATELDVADWVDLRGYVEGEELASLYRSADVFALPTSLPEGFPVSILEAMAAGLPVVTTPARGPVDHLAEGRHALFVHPHDPEALAVSLTRLLMDDELRRSMGEANLQRIREFDPDAVAEDYLGVLEEIVSSASARS